MPMKRGKGFTLIEISIVMAIIGLLIGGIVGGMVYVQNAKITSAITLAQDLSVAVSTFKQQYHMLPGDMAVTTADFPTVSAGCQYTGGQTNNGLIDTATESKCVPEILFLAGLAKVDQDGGRAVFKSSFGPVTVKAASLSPGVVASVAAGNSFPATHVVEFANLPCDVVQAIDRKIDNDILTSGKAVADLSTVADPTNPSTCAAGSIVPTYAVAL